MKRVWEKVLPGLPGVLHGSSLLKLPVVLPGLPATLSSLYSCGRPLDLQIPLPLLPATLSSLYSCGRPFDLQIDGFLALATPGSLDSDCTLVLGLQQLLTPCLQSPPADLNVQGCTSYSRVVLSGSMPALGCLDDHCTQSHALIDLLLLTAPPPGLDASSSCVPQPGHPLACSEASVGRLNHQSCCTLLLVHLLSDMAPPLSLQQTVKCC